MKLNICSFQGLWLAISKLANEDLVRLGVGGGSCGLAGRRVCVRVGCRGVYAYGFVYIFL